MNKVLWVAGLGVALLLGSCGNDRTNPRSQSPNAASDAQPVAKAPQTFPQPTVVGTNAPMPTIPVKGLLQPTNSQARLAQISTATRRDPFAAILPTQLRIATETKPQSVVNRAVQPAQKPPSLPKTQPVAQAPQRPMTPLTTLPPLPIDLTPLTPSSLPALPPTSRTSLADAVEITGVVQVGGKVTAIVQSPNESTARYVQAGEYLANGSVLLKRIIMSKNGEPTIVLQQNGMEILKSVGSTRGAVASAL
jgi:hypothetical protein